MKFLITQLSPAFCTSSPQNQIFSSAPDSQTSLIYMRTIRNIYTLCKQNAERLNIKAGGTYGYPSAFYSRYAYQRTYQNAHICRCIVSLNLEAKPGHQITCRNAFGMGALVTVQRSEGVSVGSGLQMRQFAVRLFRLMGWVQSSQQIVGGASVNIYQTSRYHFPKGCNLRFHIVFKFPS
jgi:hypothetical protein